MALTKMNIPFRYEMELVLGGKRIYPDFTIKSPASGELVYWEHFGAMDNPSYAKTTLFKLESYYKNGIVPGDNLIVTFETSSNPFSLQEAEETVRRYFL